MKKVAVICIVVALLALPAIAAAKKIRQSGQIVGDDETRVTLRVTKKQGEIRKVAKFRAEKVFTTCNKGDFRVNVTALDAAKVGDDNRFRERLRTPDDAVLRIAGKVKNGGRKVVGNLKSSEFKSGGMKCDIPRQRFKTEKA